MNVTDLEGLIPLLFTTDKSGTLLFASRNFLRLAGYSFDEMAKLDVDRVLAGDEPRTWLIQKMGSRIPVRVRKSQIDDKEVIYSLEDESQNHRLENLLEEQADILYGLFEAQSELMEGVVIAENPSLKILRASDGFKGLVGQDPIGHRLTDFLVPNGRLLFEGHLNNSQNLRRMTAETMLASQKNGATPISVSWVAVNLGYGPCFIFILRDITRRKSYEMALRQEFEAIVFTRNDTIIDANQEFCNLFGYTQKEVNGMEVTEICGPRSKDEVLHKRKSGFADTYVFEGQRKDRSLFLLQVKGRSFVFEDEPVRISTMRPLVGANARMDSITTSLV